MLVVQWNVYKQIIRYANQGARSTAILNDRYIRIQHNYHCMCVSVCMCASVCYLCLYAYLWCVCVRACVYLHPVIYIFFSIS